MRQKRLPRSQHYFSLVEQNATMKPHGIACILEVNIIRAQNVISSQHYQSSDGRQGEYICKRMLRKCKAWLTMVMIRKLEIMSWLIDWLTISGWKDKRGTRVFGQSTNEKLGAVLVVNMMLLLWSSGLTKKYRWSTINGQPHGPTHLIPFFKN